MNLGSVAARHSVFGGMHGFYAKSQDRFPTPSNLCNLGNNSNQTIKAVVDLTQGDDDSMSEEPYQVPKKHAAKCQLDNVNDPIATWRTCKAKPTTETTYNNW